jgi:hypothetical protein
VGWLRSADFRFAVTDRRDMGVFPLRNNGASKVYGRTTPAAVRAGETVTVREMTVQNLSSGLDFAGPAFDVLLEPTSGGAARNIGSFSWGGFCAYCSWSGDLSFRVPGSTPAGSYRVVVRFRGSDSDPSNDRAVFRTITVRPARQLSRRHRSVGWDAHQRPAGASANQSPRGRCQRGRR